MNKTTIIIGLLMLIMIASVSADTINNYDVEGPINGLTNEQGFTYTTVSGSCSVVSGILVVDAAGDCFNSLNYNEGEILELSTKCDGECTTLIYDENSIYYIELTINSNSNETTITMENGPGGNDRTITIPIIGNQYTKYGFQLNSTSQEMKIFINGKENNTLLTFLTTINGYEYYGGISYIDYIKSNIEEEPVEETTSSSSSSKANYAVDSEGNIVGIVANGQLITTTPTTTTTSPTLSIVGDLGFNEPTSFNLVDWIKGYWNAWFK